MTATRFRYNIFMLKQICWCSYLISELGKFSQKLINLHCRSHWFLFLLFLFSRYKTLTSSCYCDTHTEPCLFIIVSAHSCSVVYWPSLISTHDSVTLQNPFEDYSHRYCPATAIICLLIHSDYSGFPSWHNPLHLFRVGSRPTQRVLWLVTTLLLEG